MVKQKKIVFFGTPYLAVPFLKELAKYHKIVSVVTQLDRPLGRKQKITPTPVKLAAADLNIPVIQPTTLKNISVHELLKKLEADIFVVVAYGLIFPKNVIDLPKIATINVHPSILPKYRGANPIAEPILNGDAETGVSIMIMDEGLDTGQVIDIKKISLDKNETTPSLIEKIIEIGPSFLCQTIKNYLNGKIIPLPQDNDKSSFTRQLKKEDGKINWRKDARLIERQIRAYRPWPGSYTFWNKQKIEVIEAEISYEKTGYPPGRVFMKENTVMVAAAKNSLVMRKIKPQSKRIMTPEEFIRGHKDFINSNLD